MNKTIEKPPRPQPPTSLNISKPTTKEETVIVKDTIMKLDSQASPKPPPLLTSNETESNNPKETHPTSEHKQVEASTANNEILDRLKRLKRVQGFKL